jgi:hypothetical protein
MAQGFWDAKRPLVSAKGPFGSQGFSPAGLTLVGSTGVYTQGNCAFVLVCQEEGNAFALTYGTFHGA